MPRGLPPFGGPFGGLTVKTMIACAQCKTTNTLDSRFCRRCGAELSGDVLVEARAELDALVVKGTEAFEAGRIDDAMAIAEEAVHTDPTHANAHALKGMAHERRGEVAKALEAYERVVELNPDSALDRLKLNGLRAALADRATTVPDRRTPLLAGVSAAVLLACVGVAAAKMAGAPKTEPVGRTTDATGLVARAGSAEIDASGTDEAPISKVPTTRPNANLASDDVRPVGADDAVATDGTLSTPNGARALPRPRNDAPGGLSGTRFSDVEIRPAPVGPIGTGLPNPNTVPSFPTTPKTPTSTTRNVPPQAIEDPQPTVSAPVVKTGSTKKESGYIDIQVEGGARGGAPVSGGASSSANGNGAEALTRVGRAHAQGGDFDRAARAYERAIAAGADPATTNQRLGQAYERMGRKAEAKAAYGRAADGYKKRIATGKADDRDKNGLDSVNQAMKVLDRG